MLKGVMSLELLCLFAQFMFVGVKGNPLKCYSVKLKKYISITVLVLACLGPKRGSSRFQRVATEQFSPGVTCLTCYQDHIWLVHLLHKQVCCSCEDKGRF